MSSREISVWIDERWYKAFGKLLKDQTVEDYLGDVLDELCTKLPEHEYKRICQEIWDEQQQLKAAEEASRRFAVFHVSENGGSKYFLAEGNLEFMDAAMLLRKYIRSAPEKSQSGFINVLSHSSVISYEQYNNYVNEHMNCPDRVRGVYDINFDERVFGLYSKYEGWIQYSTSDVSTAAYHAGRKQFAKRTERLDSFMKYLDGKQIAIEAPNILHGSRCLQAGDISFSDEVCQDDSRLNFYMDCYFDVDEVFGTHVCTDENDDYLNVYADYDLKNRCVCDTLEVVLVGNDTNTYYTYILSDEEKALLLPKMDAYSLLESGQTLDEWCEQYILEEQQCSDSQSM